MKEFVEKLMNWLANHHRVVKTDEDVEWNRAIYSCEEEVKRLAEEHNNGCCEWEKVFDDDIDSEYKPSCSEDGYIEITGYFDYEYCPYCGKKIKIAPYQPKGE